MIRRRNKFNAKPVHDMATGESYDSTGEYKRHKQLELLEDTGYISELQRQPKVVLVERCGKAPEIAWKMDSYYIEDGRPVWEDFKPRPKTPRENLLIKLWKHFGPGLLRITGRDGKRLLEVWPHGAAQRTEDTTE